MKQERVFSIDGMTCQNCVRHVQRALTSVPGVAVSDVSIGSATVSYDPAEVTEERVLEAVREAGYQPKPQAA